MPDDQSMQGMFCAADQIVVGEHLENRKAAACQTGFCREVLPCRPGHAVRGRSCRPPTAQARTGRKTPPALGQGDDCPA